MEKKSGEITIFLSLVLAILISLLFTVIEAARTNAVRFQTEYAADTALQSVLAEYDRELLEQYDLFFTEIGYGSTEGGYILLEEHIRSYMQDNLMHDLCSLHADSAIILQAEGAADENGMVLERAAVQYMLDRYGLQELPGIQKISETVREKGFLEDTMDRRRSENEKAISHVDTRVKDKNGKRRKISIENPADEVNSRRGSSGIMTLAAVKNGISEKAARTDTFLSNREYIERNGFLQDEKAITKAEDLIFQAYMMEKCGKYTEKKEASVLDYEVEYILAGRSSDRENLQMVINRLLLLRESANFLYLMSDSAKQAEAEALAMTVSAVILFPELKDLIKLSVLIAWAYAESVNDVKILLEGGKVPLVKDAASWHLGLKNAMTLKLEEGTDNEKGLDYETYLHILLFFMNQKERNLRFMDVIEMNIRRIPNHENFCFDHCIHAFTAELSVSSDTGHDCRIVRMAGYFK